MQRQRHPVWAEVEGMRRLRGSSVGHEPGYVEIVALDVGAPASVGTASTTTRLQVPQEMRRIAYRKNTAIPLAALAASGGP